MYKDRESDLMTHFRHRETFSRKSFRTFSRAPARINTTARIKYDACG